MSGPSRDAYTPMQPDEMHSQKQSASGKDSRKTKNANYTLSDLYIKTVKFNLPVWGV